MSYYPNNVRLTSLGKEPIMTKKSIKEHVHEATHLIPGVPDHSRAVHLNGRRGLQNRPFQNKVVHSPHGNHPIRKKRVLVSWQQKVAKFFGAEGR